VGHKVSVICDECGVERLRANHWFQVYIRPTGLQFARYDAARKEADSVVCGEGHLLIQIQRYLSTGKLRREVSDGSEQSGQGQ
jgi:hypothetical protein